MTEAFLAKAGREKDRVPIAVSRLMRELSDPSNPGHSWWMIAGPVVHPAQKH